MQRKQGITMLKRITIMPIFGNVSRTPAMLKKHKLPLHISRETNRSGKYTETRSDFVSRVYKKMRSIEKSCEWPGGDKAIPSEVSIWASTKYEIRVITHDD